MTTITNHAICIRRWDFSETSQTVSLFTREHGIIRGLAKGARREKGAFSGGIDLLSYGQIVMILKPGRDLATLTAWDVQKIYWSLRTRLDAHRAGLYMADLVHHLLEAHDPHPELFDCLYVALNELDNAEQVAQSLLKFQWALLQETGYRPNLEVDSTDINETLAFSATAGGLVPDTGSEDRWRVRRETIELLRRLDKNHRQEDFETGGTGVSPVCFEQAGRLCHHSDKDSRQFPADVGVLTITRANRLLGSYLRFLMDKELTSARWLLES